MDDLLSGADTPNNAISICKDIAHVLSTRGFHLRNGILIPPNFSLNFQNIVLMMHELNFPKILMKVLKTSFTLYSIHEDFYQKLWLTKTDWDSPIPQQLTEDWLRFQKAFNAINYLTVPRWVILTADNIAELHGFADASSLAYAAAIYCRQKHNDKIKVQLLVSKTKVAPVKQVSIPRLSFLSWLSGHPRQWKTFVANRTSEIIEVLPTKHWRHVPSKENPADIASRGIDPKCLPDCKLWWQGPPWLRLETSSWPKAESSCDEASDEVKAEQKSVSIFNLFTHTSNDVIHGFIRTLLFTHQKLTTLLTQIEGLLNSRPLSYVNDSDIECISTLPPSHFLTGDVLLSVPEELPSTSNHRDRWELLQNIKRGFWKKWSSNLSPPYNLKKLQDAQPNLKEDDIVLIKGRSSWYMANGSSSSSASRQRRTGSCCNCENPRLSV
ncbi:uncharacterized protein TNCV_149791 [Trichonephila clavipes]|nr:uncharacterized protein TNCV_149791 [Trichonephila clavipes]